MHQGSPFDHTPLPLSPSALQRLRERQDAAAKPATPAEAAAASAILVVDDEPAVTAVIERLLTARGYTYLTAPSAEAAIAIFVQHEFEVVITDVHMASRSGIDLLCDIKDQRPDTEVIVMTADPSVRVAVQAMRQHADDYLVKPFSATELHQAIERAVQRRAERARLRGEHQALHSRVEELGHQCEKLFVDSVLGMVSAFEARDGSTSRHQKRVTNFALATGCQLGLSDREMERTWLGSLFHDVGKLAIPESVLNKQGPLDAGEIDQIRQHPELGARIVERVAALRPVIDVIVQHQEQWDGNGYPLGLRGEEIAIEGRVLAVCDAFDAMLSDRVYRPAFGEADAIAELRRCSGTQFDPRVVDAFLAAWSRGFPVDWQVPRDRLREMGA